MIEEMKIRIPQKQKIDTLFLGGGTPSLLDVKTFDLLMIELRAHLNLSEVQEFTLEANPGSIDTEKLTCYKNQGVSKISLGIQSFTDRNLKILGRLHSGKQALNSAELIQEHNFLISIDLMFGIPGQGLDDWKENLRQAAGLSLPHLSIYGLTFEKNTLFHQQLEKGVLQQISDEDYSSMYLTAVRILESYGLNRYEVSNFSRENCESLHNSNYWNHSPYYGLGPGAHSFDGEKRYFNSKKFVEYERFVKGGCIATDSNHETLNSDILYEETLLLGLRTTRGINPDYLKHKFKRIPAPDCLDSWISKEYMELSGESNYRLTGRGWVFLDAITVDCLAQSSYI